jgi:hypothetical protein
VTTLIYKSTPTLSFKLQSNENMMCDVINIKVLLNNNGDLSSAAYAIISTFHTTLKATPGQLVFGRDTVLPINFVADWGAIEQQP